MPTTYTIDQVLAGFVENRLVKKSMVRSSASLWDQDNFWPATCAQKTVPYVERCEYVSRGILVRKDYFSYTRYCTEYLFSKKQSSQLDWAPFTMKTDGCLQHADGRWPRNLCSLIATWWSPRIDPLLRDSSIDQTRSGDLDRETNIGQPIFEEAQKPVWVWSFTPSTSANNVDDQIYPWEQLLRVPIYQCRQGRLFFIVATDRQKKSWLSSLLNTPTISRPSIPFPVGSLTLAKTKIAFYFYDYCLTLGDRKGILTGCVQLIAQKELPNCLLTSWKRWRRRQAAFSDWWIGSGRPYPSQRTCQSGRNDKNYEVYLSASTSEGFGLTFDGGDWFWISDHRFYFMATKPCHRR